MDYADKMLLTRGPWNLDGTEDLSNWDRAIFTKHITSRGLAIEMQIAGYWHTSIHKVPGGLNMPYWLQGRLPEEYKQTRYFPDHDPFDDVVCLD